MVFAPKSRTIFKIWNRCRNIGYHGFFAAPVVIPDQYLPAAHTAAEAMYCGAMRQNFVQQNSIKRGTYRCDDHIPFSGRKQTENGEWKD
jgi:hypothetical protein